eukprot:SAG22_NODE_3112_length_1929_cov_1.940984_2_plen_85_part_00
MVAPVLVANASSRAVYLPALPKGKVWVNFFTRAVTDTSAGGVKITEQTPLDSFPLYRATAVAAADPDGCPPGRASCAHHPGRCC